MRIGHVVITHEKALQMLAVINLKKNYFKDKLDWDIYF